MSSFRYSRHRFPPEIIHSPVQAGRDKRSALKLMRKLLASAGAATGATDAALQVAAAGPTIPSTHAAINNTFSLQRHLISRRTMRQFRGDATDAWHLATCAT